MKTPKVLPWLARKAGLTDEDVETLWSSALRHASLKQPQLTPNQRMAVAMQALLARLGREKNLGSTTQSCAHIAANDAGRFAATPALVRA
ncbi:hypothetical protein KTQ42_20950 [Noviherbaspirillum sp. L7-7A]|uniref:hypothetical protein n=1 Tax=Noviherbaspirillum sp. L7-7A TaxID=2850560 RepID=UPI001C2B9F9F|nr:hypothetical protein [Noviherbaspirillum sp. L7-7A]MBV0881755.1 hypothetical protein [Noviherbaspirillum sp. L7-7A]